MGGRDMRRRGGRAVGAIRRRVFPYERYDTVYSGSGKGNQKEESISKANHQKTEIGQRRSKHMRKLSY